MHRKFVENVLSQANDSNKVKVNLELKEMIQRYGKAPLATCD